MAQAAKGYDAVYEHFFGDRIVVVGSSTRDSSRQYSGAPTSTGWTTTAADLGAQYVVGRDHHQPADCRGVFKTANQRG
jgi:hypothetical protein